MLLKNIVIKSALYWLPMVAIAFVNAILREVFILQYFSVCKAHQLSTLTLTILCLAYTWVVLPRLNFLNIKAALYTGLVWVVLTIIFEFALGRITHKSWEYLFQNYYLLKGRVWILFLICLSISPCLLYKLRKK